MHKKHVPRIKPKPAIIASSYCSCVCVCVYVTYVYNIIVAHNTTLKGSDSLPSYPPDEIIS